MINRKTKIMFLCSSGGGNLSFVWNAIRKDFLPGFELVGVISDRVCGASEYAKKIGVFNRVLESNENKWENLNSVIRELNPDFIITTIHLKLPPKIVDKHGDRLINIHYSLLPAFGGLIGAKAVESSLKYSSLIGGITIHRVTNELDKGKPYAQISFELNQRETLAEIMPLVFRCGSLGLMGTLFNLSSGKLQQHSSSFVQILNRRCLISGFVKLPNGIENDEGFWRLVRELNSC